MVNTSFEYEFSRVCPIAGAQRRFYDGSLVLVCLKIKKQAEIDENTCRKDFTPGEIYEIGQYYNEKLSRQGNNQYTEPSFGLIQTEAEHPIEVVAKIVHKGTATVSKINQIFKSDCVDIQEKVNTDEISVNEAYKQVKKAQKAKETQPLGITWIMRNK